MGSKKTVSPRREFWERVQEAIRGIKDSFFVGPDGKTAYAVSGKWANGRGIRGLLIRLSGIAPVSELPDELRRASRQFCAEHGIGDFRKRRLYEVYPWRLDALNRFMLDKRPTLGLIRTLTSTRLEPLLDDNVPLGDLSWLADPPM